MQRRGAVPERRSGESNATRGHAEEEPHQPPHRNLHRGRGYHPTRTRGNARLSCPPPAQGPWRSLAVPPRRSSQKATVAVRKWPRRDRSAVLRARRRARRAVAARGLRAPAVEAAAAVPVVASATGGLLDTVVPGQTGLLVPPGDAAALARAIEVVVANRGRAVALGRAGRERAATSFTWDGIADTLAGYYESLLGRPTRSRVEIPVSLAAAAPAASRSRIRTERSSPARTSTDRSQEVGGSTLLGS